MRHYEVTFIVDPVLSGDEVKATAEHIQKDLKSLGATIVAVDEPAIRQLAYSINKRSTGVYHCIEFSTEVADWLTKFELNMKRNERLLRYLTVKLDKYGVKYNDDKRSGRIGTRKKKETPEVVPAVAAAPTSKAAKPATETAKPAEEAPKPVTETAKPAEEAPKPVTETAKPAKEAPKPAPVVTATPPPAAPVPEEQTVPGPEVIDLDA